MSQFNENLLHKAAFLNPTPIVLLIELQPNSPLDTVLSPQLQELQRRLEPLVSCVPDVVECDYPGHDFRKFSVLDAQCKGVCKIPGAVCGGANSNFQLEEGYRAWQPVMYNNVRSISGYYQNVTDWGDELAREHFVAADERSTIVVIQSFNPKCGNRDFFYPLSDWLRQTMNQVYGDQVDRDVILTLTSYSEQLRQTADGSMKDATFAHFISIPIAFSLLAATVGVSAMFLILSMPISMFATLLVIVQFQKRTLESYGYPGRGVTYAHFSPGLWAAILLAMSVDYCLFILSRWREERKKRVVADRGASSSHDCFGPIPGRHGKNVASARTAVMTAGKTVLVSGLVLAMSFFALLLIDTEFIQQAGLSCGVLIVVTVFVHVTLLPALLVLFAEHRCCYVRSETLLSARLAVVQWLMRRARRARGCGWMAVFFNTVCCTAVYLDSQGNRRQRHGSDRAPNRSGYDPVRRASVTEADLEEIELGELAAGRDSPVSSNDPKENSDSDDGETLDAKQSLPRRTVVRRARGGQRYAHVPAIQIDEDDLDEIDLGRPTPSRDEGRDRRTSSVDSTGQTVGLLNGNQSETPERDENRKTVRRSLGDDDDDEKRGLQSDRKTSDGRHQSTPIAGPHTPGDVLDKSLSPPATPRTPVAGPDRDEQDDQQNSDNDDSSLHGPLDGGGAELIEDRQGTVRLPASSLWVRIATICRKRPWTVIGAIALLGLPLALQCIRFKISMNFEQIMLASTPAVRGMRRMEHLGFNAGVLNKQYVIVSLGPAESLGPGINETNEATLQRDTGGGGEGSCPADRDDILRKWNDTYTCRWMLRSFSQRYASGLDQDTARDIACAYDPHVDNPALPPSVKASVYDLCPTTCNASCTDVTPAPSQAMSPSPMPTVAPHSPLNATDRALSKLFECGDDVSGWISRLTPCFVEPDKRTFICKRSGRIDCAVASVAGRRCHSKRVTKSVGAAGELSQPSSEDRSTITWGHLCANMCKMCPFKQRVFRAPIWEKVSAFLEDLQSQPTQLGSHSVEGLVWYANQNVSLASAIEMLNQTRGSPPWSESTKGLPRAYRSHVDQTYSMMGSAVVVVLQPKWNTLGAHASDWVREARAVIASHEYKAKQAGLPIKYYFEGSLSMMADAQMLMYYKTPYLMAAAVTVVVIVTTALAFRSALIGLRLLCTVLFSLAWVFGLMVVLLQDIKFGGAQGDGMHFLLPLLNVPVLVGLTLDYDLFLLVRIHEARLSGMSTPDAITTSMHATSGIITVAGLIMLVAFVSLISSDLLILKITGLLISVTCFIDTFIVRAWLVPAILMVGVEWNWWPARVPPVTKRLLLY